MTAFKQTEQTIKAKAAVKPASEHTPSEFAMPLREYTDEEMEKYSYGCCMWLAMAIHDLTGWQIEVALDDESIISHAYVRLPDGKALDVCGTAGPDDYIADAAEVRSVTRDGLVALLAGNGVEDAEEVEIAKALARELFDLKPTLSPAVSRRSRRAP